MLFVVLTSDRRNWLLRGFAHQWQKYAPDLVGQTVVAGFTQPAFPMPFDFIRIGEFEDYPIERWSDALIKLCGLIPDKHFAILLEDYWLMRSFWPVHAEAAFEFASHTGAFRVDLSTDRINSGGQLTDVVTIGGLEFFECQHASYQMSFQASIFSNSGLQRVLVPGESPWQVEIDGTRRLEALPDLRVYGSRQWPCCYQIMVDKGQFKRDGSWMFPPRGLGDADFLELQALGYTSEAQAVLS